MNIFDRIFKKKIIENKKVFPDNSIGVDIKVGYASIEVGDKFKFTAVGMDYCWVLNEIYEVVDVDKDFDKGFNMRFDNVTLKGKMHRWNGDKESYIGVPGDWIINSYAWVRINKYTGEEEPTKLLYEKDIQSFIDVYNKTQKYDSNKLVLVKQNELNDMKKENEILTNALYHSRSPGYRG